MRGDRKDEKGEKAKRREEKSRAEEIGEWGGGRRGVVEIHYQTVSDASSDFIEPVLQ